MLFSIGLAFFAITKKTLLRSCSRLSKAKKNLLHIHCPFVSDFVRLKNVYVEKFLSCSILFTAGKKHDCAAILQLFPHVKQKKFAFQLFFSCSSLYKLSLVAISSIVHHCVGLLKFVVQIYHNHHLYNMTTLNRKMHHTMTTEDNDNRKVMTPPPSI